MRKRVARVTAAINVESTGGRLVIQAMDAIVVARPTLLIEKYWAKANVRPTEEGFNDGNRWAVLKTVLDGLLLTARKVSAKQQLGRLKKTNWKHDLNLSESLL